MTDNRRPMLWSRVPPDELEQATEAAKKHYEGNLSMLVRVAVRNWIVRLDESRPDSAKNEKAVA